MKITRVTVIKWLEGNHHSRDFLAEKCGVSPGAVSNWLREKNPRPIPAKAVLIIEGLMRVDAEKAAAASVTPQNLVLEFDKETFDMICDAAQHDHQRPRQWAIDRLTNLAQQNIEDLAQQIMLENPEDFAQFIQPLPCIGIAAGSPIAGDVLEEVTPPTNLGTSYLAFDVCGTSMEPLIQNRSIIFCMKKESLRNPYEKKGFIYAFLINDEYTLKKYNTRIATDEEIEAQADYLYYSDGEAKVKVLESLNSKEHADIIVTPNDHTEMIAWYDPEVNK